MHSSQTNLSYSDRSTLHADSITGLNSQGMRNLGYKSSIPHFSRYTHSVISIMDGYHLNNASIVKQLETWWRRQWRPTLATQQILSKYKEDRLVAQLDLALKGKQSLHLTSQWLRRQSCLLVGEIYIFVKNCSLAHTYFSPLPNALCLSHLTVIDLILLLFSCSHLLLKVHRCG